MVRPSAKYRFKYWIFLDILHNIRGFDVEYSTSTIPEAAMYVIITLARPRSSKYSLELGSQVVQAARLGIRNNDAGLHTHT